MTPKKRRPATLVEARKIVQTSKEQNNHVWGHRKGRNDVSWIVREDADHNIAIVHENVILLVGNTDYDTTEFVGEELTFILNKRNECEVYNVDRYYTKLVRYQLVERNSHLVWRATITEYARWRPQKKGGRMKK